MGRSRSGLRRCAGSDVAQDKQAWHRPEALFVKRLLLGLATSAVQDEHCYSLWQERELASPNTLSEQWGANIRCDC